MMYYVFFNRNSPEDTSSQNHESLYNCFFFVGAVEIFHWIREHFDLSALDEETGLHQIQEDESSGEPQMS